MILKQTNKQTKRRASQVTYNFVHSSLPVPVTRTYLALTPEEMATKESAKLMSGKEVGDWKHSVFCVYRICSAIRNGCTLLMLYSRHSRRCRGPQRCCPAGQRAPARWALLPGSFSGGVDQSYISLRHACWLGGTSVCWLWRKNKEKTDKSNGHLIQSVRLMGIKASCWTENFKTRSSAFHLDLLEALSRSLSGSRLSHISYWAGKTKTTLWEKMVKWVLMSSNIKRPCLQQQESLEDQTQTAHLGNDIGGITSQMLKVFLHAT